MKIFHLIRVDSIGGAEKVLLYGLPKLLEQGLHVELGILNPLQGENPLVAFCKEEKIPFRVFEDVGPFQWTFPLRLATLLWREKWDVLHVHGYRSVIYGALAKKICGKPIVVTRHGLLSRNRKERFIETLELKISNRFDFVIGVAPHLLGGISTQKKIIENGMKIPDPKECACVEEFPSRFLFVGRLSEEKDPLFLLSVWEKLVRYHPNIQLTVLGEGHLLQQMRFQIRKLRLENFVFLEGFQNPKQYYKDSDCLLMSSLREGLPLVALEAMSYGLPVVSTPVGVLPELLTSKPVSGCIVEKNVEPYTKQLIHLIEKRNFARELGQKGYEKVKQHYSLEQWAIRHAEVYSLLSSLPFVRGK